MTEDVLRNEWGSSTYLALRLELTALQGGRRLWMLCAVATRDLLRTGLDSISGYLVYSRDPGAGLPQSPATLVPSSFYWGHGSVQWVSR